MSFLHDRRSPIGALKSVREDKHGPGTGKEAETGRNKPAILPVALSTAIEGPALDFILNKARTLTTSGRAVHNQNRQRATPPRGLGAGFVRCEAADLLGIKQEAGMAFPAQYFYSILEVAGRWGAPRPMSSTGQSPESSTLWLGFHRSCSVTNLLLDFWLCHPLPGSGCLHLREGTP
jgi:hypothetical protein